MFGQKKLIKAINKKITNLSATMEKMKFMDYVYFIEHPMKTLWANFINGVVRGVGIAIGFTLISALVLVGLQWLVRINLPYISKLLADILGLVEFYQGNRV